MSFGLAGAQRTGKTTLAEEISYASGIPFVRTSTSDVFKKEGVDPALPMDFDTRIRLQSLVLDSAIDHWEGCYVPFITDRTPIDMLAYMMADIRADAGLSEDQTAAVKSYTERCFEAINKHFSVVILVQPGIPMVADPTKLGAGLDQSYAEHMNLLMLGALSCVRTKVSVYAIPRKVLALEDRVSFCGNRFTTYYDQVSKERVKLGIH